MLLSEGVWTLNLRLDSLVGRGLNTKAGTRTLQDARLPCGERMAYTAVKRGLDAEPAIRLLGRKDQHTKTGTLTLQDARLPCDKRMTYTAVGGSLYAKPAIRLPDRKGSIQKWAS